MQFVMLFGTGPPCVLSGAFLRPIIEKFQVSVVAAVGAFVYD